MLPSNAVVMSLGHWMQLRDDEAFWYVDFLQGVHGNKPVSEYSPGLHVSKIATDVIQCTNILM